MKVGSIKVDLAGCWVVVPPIMKLGFMQCHHGSHRNQHSPAAPLKAAGSLGSRGNLAAMIKGAFCLEAACWYTLCVKVELLYVRKKNPCITTCLISEHPSFMTIVFGNHCIVIIQGWYEVSRTYFFFFFCTNLFWNLLPIGLACRWADRFRGQVFITVLFISIHCGSKYILYDMCMWVWVYSSRWEDWSVCYVWIFP